MQLNNSIEIINLGREGVLVCLTFLFFPFFGLTMLETGTEIIRVWIFWNSSLRNFQDFGEIIYRLFSTECLDSADFLKRYRVDLRCYNLWSNVRGE